MYKTYDENYEPTTTPQEPDYQVKYTICPGYNYGWVCPKCGRVYAPHIPCCWYCGNEEYKYDWEVTSVNPDSVSVSTIDVEEIKQKLDYLEKLEKENKINNK